LAVDAVGDANEKDKKKGQGVEFGWCPNDGGANGRETRSRVEHGREPRSGAR